MRSLSPVLKALWEFIYLEANHAGIYVLDWEVAMLRLDRTGETQIEMVDALKAFNKLELTVEVSDDGNSWFLIPYVKEQHKGKLNPTNKVHESIIKILSPTKFFRHVKGLISPIEGAIDKEEVISNDKDQIKNGAQEKIINGGKISYSTGDDQSDPIENYQEWTDQVLERKDQFFETLLMQQQVDFSKSAVLDHLELLARYPNMKCANQQRFRLSLMKHIKDFKTKSISTGKAEPVTPVYHRPAMIPAEDIVKKSNRIVDMSVSIEQDKKKMAENPEYEVHLGSMKYDHLQSKGLASTTEEERNRYMDEARGERIRMINLDMDNIDNRSLNEQYKMNKEPESEKIIIRGIAKSMAYIDWLKNEIQINELQTA